MITSIQLFSRPGRSISGLIAGTIAATALLPAAALGQTNPNFGPNVTILTPGMSASAINSALNGLNGETQFSTNRHAVLFMPGTYGSAGAPVAAQVGYYESVAGLGTSPNQVTITGGLSVDQILDGNMLQNFWRSQENLAVVPVGGLANGTLDWGVSQGASLRRINVEGNLAYVNSGSIGTTNPCAEASGGFTADIAVSGNTNPCSQQQWFTRNSSMNGWSGFVWNYVFSGVLGAPAQSYPGGGSGLVNVTNVANTPASREKPFLYVDGSGNYFVFSPGLETNSRGTSWSGGGLGIGTSLPLSSFFIAQPSNTVADINTALASGKNLILTPGVYQYSQAITVTNPNTVVLGMGFATLIPQAGNAAISVADVDGVQVAGLIVDAGPTRSPVLFEVGTPGAVNASHASNPTSLNDLVIRIGGQESTAVSAGTGLQVDSNNVIVDNLWSWRADHGSGPVGWTVNTADHGLVVNGSNVTALGLAVEHYQKEQVLWNGNGGKTIFYQSELPYDVPNQAAWMDGSANGYPSYVVAPGVCTHNAYGLGIYSFFDVGPNIIEDNAMTVPNSAGVSVTDVGTVWLNGYGSITHAVNGVGPAANSASPDVLEPVASYSGTGSCTITAPVPSPVPSPVSAPTGLEAVSEPPSGSITVPYVQLGWNAPSGGGVTYTVYRATGSGAATAIATGVASTVYSDKTVNGNTTYTYYVAANNSTGTASAASNSVTLTTGGSPTGGINTAAWYNVINQTSGKCLDAAGFGTGNGTFVQQWACGSHQYNQEWQFQSKGNGIYSIVNRNAPSEVLDVTNVATGDFSPIQTWTYGGGTNQQWTPIANGNYFVIQGVGSSRCLDVNGSSTANGVQMQLFDCNNTGAQNWMLVVQP